MTILERLDAAAREYNDALKPIDYEIELADMRDLLEDAAKCIRHLEASKQEMLRALANADG